MMDVEGGEDDGDATTKFIATKTERLVFTWPIRFHHFHFSISLDATTKFIATKTERLVFTWPIKFYYFTFTFHFYLMQPQSFTFTFHFQGMGPAGG